MRNRGSIGVLERIDNEPVEVLVLSRVVKCKCWTGHVDMALLSPQSRVEYFAPPREHSKGLEHGMQKSPTIFTCNRQGIHLAGGHIFVSREWKRITGSHSIV